jgi:hypothetical protein
VSHRVVVVVYDNPTFKERFYRSSWNRNLQPQPNLYLRGFAFLLFLFFLVHFPYLLHFNMSIDFPKEEEATIERWRGIGAFERQVCPRLSWYII